MERRDRHEGEAGKMGYVGIVADLDCGRRVCATRVEADFRIDGGVDLRFELWADGPEGRGTNGCSRRQGYIQGGD